MARTPTLVCVFLRGAADGLALVPPTDEPALHTLRPTLARAPTVALAPGFALHARLAPLLPAFRAGELAIVHAVGSDDDTRSHFDAQERMERAGARAGSEPSGWLARHLRTRRGADPSALTAVAIGSRVPDVLACARTVAVIEPGTTSPLDADRAFRRALAALHARDDGDPVHRSGRDAIDALGRLTRTRATGRSAAYGEHAFGAALREIARLVRADVGLEIATVDLGGWDTHLAQSSGLEEPVSALSAGLSAFRDDLGDVMENVVVVVMTELGRRVYENAALGTDHGSASVMLVMGGGIRGGRVVTRWPGLDPASLVPPGDLRVTIDYRDVLAEIVSALLGNERIDEVFPGFDASPIGLGG